MKQSWIKRLDHLEDRQGVWRQPGETFSRVEIARRTAFVMALGGVAKEELDAADDSLDPARRAELTKTLETARSIASALAKCSRSAETAPGAQAVIPGTLDAQLVELIAIPGEHFGVTP